MKANKLYRWPSWARVHCYANVKLRPQIHHFSCFQTHSLRGVNWLYVDVFMFNQREIRLHWQIFTPNNRKFTVSYRADLVFSSLIKKSRRLESGGQFFWTGTCTVHCTLCSEQLVMSITMYKCIVSAQVIVHMLNFPKTNLKILRTLIRIFTQYLHCKC